MYELCKTCRTFSTYFKKKRFVLVKLWAKSAQRDSLSKGVLEGMKAPGHCDIGTYIHPPVDLVLSAGPHVSNNAGGYFHSLSTLVST